MGDAAFLRDEEVVVDLRLGFGFEDVLEEAVVVFLLLNLVAGAVELEGPSPGDARRGGLKGSRRRFWAGWRSTGMLVVSMWKRVLLALAKGPKSAVYRAMACVRE